eukprot:265796_1
MKVKINEINITPRFDFNGADDMDYRLNKYASSRHRASHYNMGYCVPGSRCVLEYYGMKTQHRNGTARYNYDTFEINPIKCESFGYKWCYARCITWFGQFRLNYFSCDTCRFI